LSSQLKAEAVVEVLIKMAGVVLETLSNRKLIVFGSVLLLIQIGFFLIGGLIGESVCQHYPRV